MRGALPRLHLAGGGVFELRESMNSKITFSYRCTAFGISYYDCRIFTGSGRTEFEVEHTGCVESLPEITMRYGQPAGEEVETAWRAFCEDKRKAYAQWLKEHPDCKEFDTVFRAA